LLGLIASYLTFFQQKWHPKSVTFIIEEQLSRRDSMPANLPPPYFEAEKRYREARTAEDKLEALEQMLTIMPKHKGTDKLRADLRKRIAKVKAESQQRKGASRRDVDCRIDKEGAAQVVLVGAPNTGKSSLVAVLTNARPEIGAFPHTTWKPTAGMAFFENVQFQLVDTPAISKDFVDPWMTDLLRRADILAIVVDLQADALNQLDQSCVILHELRIFPVGSQPPAGLLKPPFFKKILLLANKMDSHREEEDFEVFLELSQSQLPALGVSTRTGRNLARVPEQIYRLAQITRVYTKAPGKEPDRTSPFVLTEGSTLEDLAAKIHKDFVAKLKFARVWGSAVYDGQMVQRDYIMQDGDVVEIHI
jgi:hypothetical protein